VNFFFKVNYSFKNNSTLQTLESMRIKMLCPCWKIAVHNFKHFSLRVQCVAYVCAYFAKIFILWMLWNANPLPRVVHQRGEVSQGQGHLGLNAPYPTNKTSIGPAFPNLPSQFVVFPWILGCISVLSGHQLLSRGQYVVLHVLCPVQFRLAFFYLFIYFQSLYLFYPDSKE